MTPFCRCSVCGLTLLAAVLPLPALAQAPDAAAVMHLPRDLSPWGMFLGADIVVKAVMIGLGLASVLSWTVWLGKTVELASARRRLRRAIAVLGSAPSLTEAAERLPTKAEAAAALIEAAESELALSADALMRAGAAERVASRLERLQAAAVRQAARGSGILASIGATAPFVGLFGTVWGIMNAFIGISKAQTTNLAVVAPGIAEALLATALGLVAAIPAVLLYNALTRAAANYRAEHADAAAAVLRLVSRDLDRTLAAHAEEPRRAPAAAE
jgi:biopolymer transport protein ExbB